MSSQNLDGLKINSRVTLLEPGMYIFRYASQSSPDRSVSIALQQAPLGKGVIDFFPAEGISKNILTKLGDCIIGRVKGGVTTVLITEYCLANVEIDPVDLRIDRIDTSPAIMRNFSSQNALVEASPQTLEAQTAARLTITGHIERTGDVTVADRWLGEPGSNARLEGFAITWENKPEGVELVYASTIAGSGPSQKVLSGRYTGTRGKASEIVAVGFGLTGPKRDLYQLSGHVAFAGAAEHPIVADQMLFGPSGKEPLVALNISITPKTEINALRYSSRWEKPATTQIFKEGQMA